MAERYQRLDIIAILLPQEKDEERSFFLRLLGLLLGVPEAQTNAGALFFMPSAPEKAQPYTMMQLADVIYPAILLSTDRLIHVEAGRLMISTLPPQIMPAVVPPADDSPVSTAKAAHPLPLDQLTLYLHGRLTRLDHFGVNIPAKLVSREDWDELLRRLGLVSNIYRYPTGEDWPFILPATAKEFKGEIAHFVAGRGPKFEFVYDTYTEAPVLQIDVETDIERDEMEQFFPEPHGMALPGVGEFFRSVYIDHPWPGLLIRVDMRYRSSGPPSEWDTGEWLVKSGGRIHSEGE